jgi:hypothetical protein
MRPPPSPFELPKIWEFLFCRVYFSLKHLYIDVVLISRYLYIYIEVLLLHISHHPNLFQSIDRLSGARSPEGRSYFYVLLLRFTYTYIPSFSRSAGTSPNFRSSRPVNCVPTNRAAKTAQAQVERHRTYVYV